MSTPTTLVLALVMLLSQPPSGCFDPREQAGRAQPPAPDEPTPVPRTPEPGEPVDPPPLEESTPEPDPDMPTPDPSAPCCYSNPRYAGACVVTPSGGETCASILAYLNDPSSTGKTYCSRTDVRGGWEPIACVAR